MNFRLLAKILGVLLCLIGLGMVACMGYAWHEMQTSPEMGREALRSLGWSAGITIGIGALGFIIGRGTGNEVLRREAMVVVGLGWILSAAAGCLPFVIGKPHLSFAGAYFESMSGFTTTGSTVITDLDLYPRAVLLWRSVTQWLGGIGIVVLFVAVLSFLGVGSRSLMQHESSLNISDTAAARIRDVAKKLLLVYVGLTALCALGLWWLGMTPYEAINHAMTTISTGGFSTDNKSIGHWNSLAIEVWLTLFMLLGGVSFMLYVFIANRRWGRLKAEEEARYYVLLLAAACLAIGSNLWLTDDNTGFLMGIRRAFFTIVSISTTTGFGTEDYDQWPTFSRLLLLGLMAVGGCAGSTAGGVKMNRVILFTKISVQELVKSFRPHQVFRLRLNGTTPDDSVRLQTMLFLSFAFGTVGMAALMVALLEPHLDLTSSFAAVLATLFNIGPGMGMVGPTDNFASLHPTSLILLSLVMALGRLEFFAVLVLFLPSLWRRY
ncbi:MAG: TrkH family potassium uptake protein [Verrucomicrobiae bacterium]|nr:TrkH family potassium uptake protein [Verrucomicrobiae bacterium]